MLRTSAITFTGNGLVKEWTRSFSLACGETLRDLVQEPTRDLAQVEVEEVLHEGIHRKAIRYRSASLPPYASGFMNRSTRRPPFASMTRREAAFHGSVVRSAEGSPGRRPRRGRCRRTSLAATRRCIRQGAPGLARRVPAVMRWAAYREASAPPELLDVLRRRGLARFPPCDPRRRHPEPASGRAASIGLSHAPTRQRFTVSATAETTGSR